jgi:hypothetical protein
LWDTEKTVPTERVVGYGEHSYDRKSCGIWRRQLRQKELWDMEKTVTRDSLWDMENTVTIYRFVGYGEDTSDRKSCGIWRRESR